MIAITGIAVAAPWLLMGTSFVFGAAGVVQRDYRAASAVFMFVAIAALLAGAFVAGRVMP
jgi:hypothetical protein